MEDVKGEKYVQKLDGKCINTKILTDCSCEDIGECVMEDVKRKMQA